MIITVEESLWKNRYEGIVVTQESTKLQRNYREKSSMLECFYKAVMSSRVLKLTR